MQWLPTALSRAGQMLRMPAYWASFLFVPQRPAWVLVLRSLHCYGSQEISAGTNRRTQTVLENCLQHGEGDAVSLAILRSSRFVFHAVCV